MMDRWLRRLYFCAGVSEIRLSHVTRGALIPSYRVKQPNRSLWYVERCYDCVEVEFDVQGIRCSQCYILQASFYGLTEAPVYTTYSLFVRFVPCLRGGDPGAAFGCASVRNSCTAWQRRDDRRREGPSLRSRRDGPFACPGSSAPAGNVRLHYTHVVVGFIDLLLGVVIRGGSVAGAATSRRRRGSGIAAS